MRAAVYVILPLVACSAPAPPPCPPATAHATTTATTAASEPASPFCRDEVASLEGWLRSIEAAGLPLAMSLLDEGASLVERPGSAITEPAPLVHVTTALTYLDGIPSDSAEQLSEELTALLRLRKEMMPESPFTKSPHCHLAVSASVPWQKVETTVAAIRRAGFERVTFLFSDSTRTVPAPPKSNIDAELARMKKSAPVRRGQIIAELMAYVYQDCQPGLRVIANMGVNPLADFKQAILEALPEAIGACDCAPDDASVKALHWALFGNPRPSSGVTITVAAEDERPLHVVRLAPDVPWSKAHVGLAEADGEESMQPVRLLVAPQPEPEPAPESSP